MHRVLKKAAHIGQDAVQARRRANLRAIAAQWNGVTGLSKKLGYRGPSYLSQMIGANHSRPVSESTARQIEHAVGLPQGWLDQEHADLVRSAMPPAREQLNEPLFLEVAQAVQHAIETAGVVLTQEKSIRVFLRVYNDAIASGRVNSALALDLVRLAS